MRRSKSALGLSQEIVQRRRCLCCVGVTEIRAFSQLNLILVWIYHVITNKENIKLVILKQKCENYSKFKSEVFAEFHFSDIHFMILSRFMVPVGFILE